MADNLRNLIDEILKNPECIDKLDAQQAVEVYKSLGMCGVIPSPKKVYANMSVTNFREEYLWKLAVTTVVGYLYRTVDDYEDETPESEFEYLKDAAYGLNLSEEQYRKIVNGERKRRTATVKTQARRFLDHNFNFNPDRHVMSSYKENLKDPERYKRHDAMRRAMTVAEGADGVTTEMQKNPAAAVEFAQDLILKTFQGVNAAKKLVNKIGYVLNGGEGDVSSLVGLLLKFDVKFTEIADTLKPFADPLAAKGVVPAYVPDPPIDVFYHLRRYYTNHYEQLREAVQVLYAEKPDIEFAIQLYDVWSGDDAKKQAEEHQRKNEGTIIAPIFTLENGGWTLMGSFQENRDRVSFYNKDTEIIKRMFEQMEQDHKTGKMLMEKRVRKEKAKNIVEEGPDDPGLKNYRSAVDTVAALGAKQVLSEEEKRELSRATRVKEMAEVPSNAIQVDVFGKGEDGNFTRNKFYTESEAPQFMQDQIEEQKRQLLAHGVPMELPGKIVRDRHGNEKNVAELRNAGASAH